MSILHVCAVSKSEAAGDSISGWDVCPETETQPSASGTSQACASPRSVLPATGTGVNTQWESPIIP